MNILVIRLSSLGDVALTIPVIKAVLEQNSEVKITVITRKAFVELFEPLGVECIVPSLYGKHKGVFGLFRFYKELRKIRKWDAFLDLHNVIRSKILRAFFKINGIKVIMLDKGRKEKKLLTRKKNKIIKPLPHITERYASVFRKAGLSVDLTARPKTKSKFELTDKAKKAIGNKKGKRIGIAPFAKHKEKIYPLEKMKQVIGELDRKGHKVYIFGAGDKERKWAENIVAQNPNAKILIGNYSMSEELAMMASMDLMVCMDSASMHLSTLAGTKVISIWGATHPFAGFIGFGQDVEERIIQTSTNDLACRPCSVFGDKPCFRGDMACMNMITSKQVFERIESVLEA